LLPGQAAYWRASANQRRFFGRTARYLRTSVPLSLSPDSRETTVFNLTSAYRRQSHGPFPSPSPKLALPSASFSSSRPHPPFPSRSLYLQAWTTAQCSAFFLPESAFQSQVTASSSPRSSSSGLLQAASAKQPRPPARYWSTHSCISSSCVFFSPVGHHPNSSCCSSALSLLYSQKRVAMTPKATLAGSERPHILRTCRRAFSSVFHSFWRGRLLTISLRDQDISVPLAVDGRLPFWEASRKNLISLLRR